MPRRREGRRVSFLPRRDKQKPGAGSAPLGLMRTWMRCRRLTGGAKKVPAAPELLAHMPKRKVSNGAVAEPIFDAVQRRTSLDWT